MKQTWYKQLGFYNNPFSIKPAAFHDDIVGYEKEVEQILDLVEMGAIISLEGDFGLGKTSILKRIVAEFGGNKKIVYYSCNTTESNIDYDKLLIERHGFIGRLLKLKSKEMILLLDEAQDLSAEDSEKLLEYYREGFFKSIVLVSKEGKNEYQAGIKKLIGKNIFKLKKLSDEEAVKLVRKRIGNLSFLTDDMIIDIYKKSENNPRVLLENCEDVCKEAVEEMEDKVQKEQVKNIIDKKALF
ncbi:hypothetical protein J4468_00780 [Candidatus Woesearchaeota archaeon]|nr:hypothetical protein [Candidatus Woesearchaeota archaeon]